MDNQYAANFLQLNDTFVGIDHLLKKHRFFCYMGERMASIKLAEKIIKFFDRTFTWQLRTDKNASCKISPPGNKMYTDFPGWLELLQ